MHFVFIHKLYSVPTFWNGVCTAAIFIPLWYTYMAYTLTVLSVAGHQLHFSCMVYTIVNEGLLVIKCQM